MKTLFVVFALCTVLLISCQDDQRDHGESSLPYCSYRAGVRLEGGSLFFVASVGFRAIELSQRTVLGSPAHEYANTYFVTMEDGGALTATASDYYVLGGTPLRLSDDNSVLCVVWQRLTIYPESRLIKVNSNREIVWDRPIMVDSSYDSWSVTSAGTGFVMIGSSIVDNIITVLSVDGEGNILSGGTFPDSSYHFIDNAFVRDNHLVALDGPRLRVYDASGSSIICDFDLSSYGFYGWPTGIFPDPQSGIFVAGQIMGEFGTENIGLLRLSYEGVVLDTVEALTFISHFITSGIMLNDTAVIVVGTQNQDNQSSGADFFTAFISLAGRIDWMNFFSVGNVDQVNGIFTLPDSSIVVYGEADRDAYAYALNPQGQTLWTSRFAP